MAGGVDKEEMKQCLKDANIYEDHLSDDLISQYYKAIKNSETSLIEESEVEEGAKSLNDSANELLEAINNSESIAPSKKRRFLSADNDEESLDGFSPDSLEQSKPKPIEDEANNNNYNHGTVKRIQRSSHLLDIDKITFNEMPKSNNKNLLKIVTHEPQFINVQNSRQFLDGDQQMRLKLLTDYHFAVAQRREDFARTLSNMAPKLKPITAVNHNLLVNPVLSALKEDKALNATETYVSRSGRMTKRKVYNDEYEELATDESSVPPKKSRSDDNWTSKNTVRRLSSKKGESSEALSSGSVEDTSPTKQYVKPKRGESPDSSQDIVAAGELTISKESPEAPKPRTYQKRTPSNREIISRSTLFKDLDTPRKGRSAAILSAAKEKDESRKREEQEMTRFADSLDSQIVDDDDDDDYDGIYNDSEHILVDGDIEVIEKRRISPLLPIRRRSIWPKKGNNTKVAEPLNITAKKLNSPHTSSPLVNGAIGKSLLPKRAVNNNTVMRAEASVSTTPKNKNKQNMTVCPLCSMSFSRKEIEEHASTCGEDMFPQSSQPQRIACEICDTVVPFSTNYEVHVKECIAKRSSRT